MKARYNVVVQSDHLIVMQKLQVCWDRLTTEERLALHVLVEAKVQAIQDAVPLHALPKEVRVDESYRRD